MAGRENTSISPTTRLAGRIGTATIERTPRMRQPSRSTRSSVSESSQPDSVRCGHILRRIPNLLAGERQPAEHRNQHWPGKSFHRPLTMRSPRQLRESTSTPASQSTKRERPRDHNRRSPALYGWSQAQQSIVRAFGKAGSQLVRCVPFGGHSVLRAGLPESLCPREPRRGEQSQQKRRSTRRPARLVRHYDRTPSGHSRKAIP